MTTRPTVYYDGACPVCSREVGFYRERPGGECFDWVDVTRPDAILGSNLTREIALRRMHVRLADGRLVSGAGAFGAIWRELHGFRWLGRVMMIPPFEWLAELAYRAFLLLRRMWRRQ